MATEIEKMLNQDIATQKKNLSGVRCRASRTGRISSMRTPSSFLTGIERQEYLGIGKFKKVEVYSMWDIIMSFEEFMSQPKETQVEIIKHWQNKCASGEITQKDIEKVWGKKVWKYREIVSKYGLQIHQKSSQSKNKNTSNINSPVNNVSYNPEPKHVEPEPEPELLWRMNKEYDSKQIKDELFGLAGYFESKEGKFKLKIEIVEISE